MLSRNRKRLSSKLPIAVDDEISSELQVRTGIAARKALEHGQQLSKTSVQTSVSSKIKGLASALGFAPSSLPVSSSDYHAPEGLDEFTRTGLDFEQDIPTRPDDVVVSNEPTEYQIIEEREFILRSSNIDPRELREYFTNIFATYIGEWGEDLEKSWKQFGMDPPLDLSLLQDMLNSKTQFDDLYKQSPQNYKRARNEMNPYESIDRACFLNRAAVKMANIDFAFNLLKPYIRGHTSDRRYLFFADICAAPGGFSEYIVWRCGGRARGFGLSLRDERDTWRVSDFNEVSKKRSHHEGGAALQILYGRDECFKTPDGEVVHSYKCSSRGNGDITDSDNVIRFSDHVIGRSNGVDVVVADGGADVSDGWNQQELLMKQLVLGQIHTMFRILRRGGSFVLKVFDIFSPFTVSLLYILYASFQRFSIFKPVTSRPANSERYIVCQGLDLGGTPSKIFALNEDARMSIIAALFNANNTLHQFARARAANGMTRTQVGGHDLRSLLNPHVMEPEFMNFVKKNIESHLKNQIRSLQAVYNRLVYKIPPPLGLDTIADDCYALWRIPGTRDDTAALVNLMWQPDEQGTHVKKIASASLPMAMRLGIERVASNVLPAVSRPADDLFSEFM
ncbi:hypothetical protein RCL1_005193 [Eukaryota sp. TZLM3-RCL]